MTVFNRKESTLSCLKSVYDLCLQNCYIINVFLTNDGCTDGTPEEVARNYPEVTIINGNGNLFWNRGMWTAWNVASKKNFDFYLWLNDDTFLYPNALEELLKASSLKDNKSILVGSTKSSKTAIITYGGYTKDKRYVIPNGDIQHVHHFNGNIVLVPRYVYNVLGNLDPFFTHSNGDIDYGMRGNEAGISSFIVGEYLGECERHTSLDKWCNPDYSLKERWKALHKPNGMPPKEKFYLQRKHQNIFVATFHFFTIYLRCFIPQLWRLKK